MAPMAFTMWLLIFKAAVPGETCLMVGLLGPKPWNLSDERISTSDLHGIFADILGFFHAFPKVNFGFAGMVLPQQV